MDVFAEHSVPGMVGLIFNGFFAASYIIALDGVNANITGGWIQRRWVALGWQLAYIAAATGYSFVVSYILAFVINIIPGLVLRASENAELIGIDDTEIGEFAYDYIEVRRDYLAWTPTHGRPTSAKDAEITPEKRHGIPEHAQILAESKSTAGSDTSETPTPVPTTTTTTATASAEKKASDTVSPSPKNTTVAGDRHAAGVPDQ
jgi:Amt family ammonium transporter